MIKLIEVTRGTIEGIASTNIADKFQMLIDTPFQYSKRETDKRKTPNELEKEHFIWARDKQTSSSQRIA